MTFTLTLELAPGTTYAEIKRQVELVASQLPDDPASKPDGPECVRIDYANANPQVPGIHGELRLDR